MRNFASDTRSATCPISTMTSTVATSLDGTFAARSTRRHAAMTVLSSPTHAPALAPYPYRLSVANSVRLSWRELNACVLLRTPETLRADANPRVGILNPAIADATRATSPATTRDKGDCGAVVAMSPPGISGRAPFPRCPVRDRVRAVVGHALVLAAVDRLGFGRAYCYSDGRTTGLDVDRAGVHPRVADALVGKEPRERERQSRRSCAQLRPACGTVERVGVSGARVAGRHVQAREHREPIVGERHQIHRARGVHEHELQVAPSIAPSRRRTDVHGIRRTEVPAHDDEVGARRLGRILATAVAGEQVDLRQFASAGRVEVASVVTEIRAPHVAVLPRRNGRMTPERVPRLESTYFVDRRGQVRSPAAIRNVVPDSTRRESHGCP